MKHFLGAFLLTILLVLSSASSNANEEGFAIKSLAVVDLKKIVDESKAAKAAEDQVNELKEKYLKEAEKQEKALKKQEEQLKKQQKAISEEAFIKKIEEFQKKIIKERQEVAKNRKVLEASYVKSLELIKMETLKVIKKIAEEENIDVILPSSSFLYYNNRNARDISEAVLDALNKELPKVKINIKEG
jgi:outer membrane protein